MLTRRAERLLPYSSEQLFDLAADVETYPKFLHWWKAARVKRRDGDVYYTDQDLAFGPVRVRFDSKTSLHRPDWIEVTSYDPPFREFKLSWTFETLPDVHCCRVRLIAGFELRSRLLQEVVERLLPDIMPEVITAFESRAARLYGRNLIAAQQFTH
jgi:coenzyme Q-binding protein COQ10